MPALIREDSWFEVLGKNFFRCSSSITWQCWTIPSVGSLTLNLSRSSREFWTLCLVRSSRAPLSFYSNATMAATDSSLMVDSMCASSIEIIEPICSVTAGWYCCLFSGSLSCSSADSSIIVYVFAVTLIALLAEMLF